MKTLLTISLVTAGLLVYRSANAGRPAAPATNTPASLELSDQFEAPQKLSFPATGLTLLTIADRQGSEHIAGWVTPVKQRFGSRIDIRGIADVSSVPAPLRSMVRKKFQKLQTHPVMMDWEGVAVKRFAPVAGKANILVLDSHGKILARLSGEANASALQNLSGVIERALAEPKSKAAAK
jgi:hypothetical protein